MSQHEQDARITQPVVDGTDLQRLRERLALTPGVSYTERTIVIVDDPQRRAEQRRPEDARYVTQFDEDGRATSGEWSRDGGILL